MNKLNLLNIFIIIACITLTSCEKDNAFAPDPKEPLAKNKSMSNKSGNDTEYWLGLSDFAYFMIEGYHDSVQNMEAEKTILYTESVLDYTMVNDDVPMIKHGKFGCIFKLSSN